jgi:ABC-type multidrug transport system fused ATPase/permease subunit
MTQPVSHGPAKGTSAILRWLWRDHMSRRKPLIALAVLFMVVEGSMMGALSFMMKPLFDRVFIAGESSSIPWVVLALSGTFALRALSSVGQSVTISKLHEGINADIQAGLLTHLMRLDLAFYQRHPPGVLIERVRGDTAQLKLLFAGVFVPFVRDTVALIALIGVTIYIDWRWTLIALLGAPLIIVPVERLQARVRRTSGTARAAAARASARLDEIFHGIATVHLTGTEKREHDRYRRTVQGYVQAQVRAETAGASIAGLVDIVAAFGFAAVLVYGSSQIIEGEKTVGEFMAFFTAMGFLFEPLRRLGGVSASLQSVMAGLDRVQELWSEPVRVVSPANPAAQAQAGRIVFEDVHFAYDSDPVLRGLSFVAQPGQTTAIVGPSGAGKSTVFALLTRQADVQSGAVRINDADVRDMALGDLRALFSTVAQDTALFDESLRDNITMGREVSPEALDGAIEAAHVHEFLTRMPQGLDTPAGPRGSALSGGQRQRVAIARALLRGAPILLLDEATSALDARSEALVQSALETLAKGRTTLVIAHRLATVQGADRIIVMDKGRVVEEGSHAELIARGGVYADLCRLQFEQGSEGLTQPAPAPISTP